MIEAIFYIIQNLNMIRIACHISQKVHVVGFKTNNLKKSPDLFTFSDLLEVIHSKN